MAGNGFSGEQILTLTGERILLIWYRLRNKPLLKSIEWSSLSAELVGKHFSLFTNDELDALTADNTPQFKDIVTSALKRHPQGVLFALYKSLLDTQGCGGAAQHASIAKEIQEETLATPGLQPAFTTDGTHPSAAVPGYPSNSQLASAEHDRGLRVGQEDGTATTYHPTWQTGKVSTMMERQDSLVSQPVEDRRSARFQYYGVESASQGVSRPVQQQSVTTPTYPSALGPDGPSLPRSALAEHDRRPNETQAHTAAATANPPQQTLQAPHQASSEDRRPARLDSHGVDYSSRAPVQQQGESLMYANSHSAPDPGFPSQFVSASPEHDQWRHATQAHSPAATAHPPPTQTVNAEGTHETPEHRQLEEWEDIVEFIPRCFENAHGDVLPAILREMGETASQLLRISSELHIHRLQNRALQGVVERCRMKWYEFAQFLLKSKTTRPYISKIAKYTQLSITDAFKEVLRKHLGNGWYQLATAMGLGRTERDAIKDRTDVGLLWKINTFLEKQEFPLFQSERDTAEFLVKTLEAASLPNVADDVKEALAVKLRLEGLESTAQYMPSQHPQNVLQDIFHGSQTSCNQQDASDDIPRSVPRLPQKTRQTSPHGAPEAELLPSSNPALKQPTSAADPSHELEARTSRVEVISVNQNDDVFAVFAAFDGPMNEGEVLQTISNYSCPGVILAQQEDNKQLVHFAAEKGYTNVLKWLFEMGHEINAEMTKGQTPFLLACEAGHDDTIRFLLTCDPELVLTKDSLGRSCLHFPAILRNLELTHHLIWDKNADLDAQSSTGVTPLSVGCIMGDLPTVQNLVQAMTLKLFRSETSWGKLHKPSRLPPLHAAAFGGHQHIMEFLLDLVVNATEDHESIVELIDVGLRSQNLYTALHIAASRGYLEIVQMLVQRSANMVNAAARDATTPLLLAAASGHEDVVKYLLEHGADVDSMREVRKGTFHLTPLAEAVLGRHVEVARVLLDEGADVRFKAGGTTSILALACIGGDEQIVEMVLHELGSDIINAFDKNDLPEIFEMPFVVSVNFEDFKCAKRLMDAMSGFIGDIDDVIRRFSVKAKLQLKQYKEAVSIFQIPDLPNQGDTCRRVAGSRTSAMYHLCYDDGPHWATELMQLCFMFESFNKPQVFHDTYEQVYVEASHCILQTLQEQGYSWTDLAGEAIERNSNEAAQFFTQYGENQLNNRIIFLEQVHNGNPSAMGLCCELVSADILQDTYSSFLAGPVAQQYFREMSRRELKHPGQFRMKFSKHGGSGTGVRMRSGGQTHPCHKSKNPVAHSTPVQTKLASASHVPNPPFAQPHLSALQKQDTPSTPDPLKERPALLEASGSLNPQYIPNPGSVDLKLSNPATTEDPKVSQCSVNAGVSASSYAVPNHNLDLPKLCTQENDSEDSFIMLPDVKNNDRMRERSGPSGSSAQMQHNSLTPRSDPSLAAPPDAKLSKQSCSTTANSGEPHSDSHGSVPLPPSFTSVAPLQLASVVQQSDGTGHSPKTVPTHTVAQSNVELPSQSSHGYHTMDHSSMGPNPLWAKAEESAMLTSTGSPYSQQPQQRNSNPENAEKSECDTAPELNRQSDVVRSSESVTDLNRSSSSLLPTPPPLSLQPSSDSCPQPNPPEPLQLSHAAEVPRLSRPDTIGGDVQDDVPPAPPAIAMGGAPDQPENDEGLADSVSSEPDTAAARSSNQPAPADSADYVPQQSSSQADAPHTSPKSYAAPSVTHTKEHSLSACAANHPVQQSEPALHDDNLEEEDNEDDAQSDITYLSSTSASTTHNVNVDDSRRNSMSHNVPASGPAVQPNTAPVKALNPLASSAVATTGQSEVSPSVSMHTTAALPQSNATGQDQSENSGRSVPTPVHNCESPLSSHPSQPPSSHPPYETPSLDSYQPPSPQPDQSSSPHPNTSSKVPSQVNPMVVRPPSEVPYVTESSMETYQSAATVVEAPYQAEVTTPPASSKHIELSSVPKFERHDSGYPGSNQFDSSVLLGRHGNMEPQARAPMEDYQLEQDMRESSQSAESMGQIGDQLIGSSTQEQEERLTDLSRQVGRKWSMLARYAGLKEDEVQEIKDAQKHAEDRSCVAMEKIQGRLTWNELLFIVHKQMHMLNSAAKLQDFLGHQVDALPMDVVQKEIDPQQHGRTVLLASQCVSEHWRELAQHLGIDSREHWEVLEQSTEDDEKCLELLMLWLRSHTNVTLQQLLQAVESTSASAGTLHQLIEKAQEFPDDS